MPIECFTFNMFFLAVFFYRVKLRIYPLRKHASVGVWDNYQDDFALDGLLLGGHEELEERLGYGGEAPHDQDDNVHHENRDGVHLYQHVSLLTCAVNTKMLFTQCAKN